MQRATECDLAFDIDDLAAAKPHLSRDPARRAERESAEADHRQPVDLADRVPSVSMRIVPRPISSCRR